VASRSSADAHPARTIVFAEDGDHGLSRLSQHAPEVAALPKGVAARAVLFLLLVTALLGPIGATVPSGVLLLLAPLTLCAAVAMVAFDGMLGRPAATRMPRQLMSAVSMGTLTASVGALTAGLVGVGAPTSAWAVAGTLTTAVLLAGPRWRAREVGRLAQARRVLLVASAEQAAEVFREIQRHGDTTLVGLARYDHQGSLTADDVLLLAAECRPTMLVLSDDAMRDTPLVVAAGTLHRRGVRVRDLRAFYEQSFKKVAVADLAPSWFLFDVAEIHSARMYGTVRRIVEVAAACTLLVLLAPLFPLVALIVRASSVGPILFRQARVGKDGETFTLVKFRTMHTAPGSEHGQWMAQSTARLFPAGRWMRKFRLDELPQLWNILRGDLSLVGPRPEQPAIVDRLAEQIPYYRARLAVRPGLTGWAQVNFGYGGSDDGSLTKLQYDLYYVKRQSVALDLRIMVATLRTVLGGSGVS